jgi:hypothetical protein
MTFAKFNRHLHPQGGRWFRDEDGIVHKATSWPELAVKVKVYRERAGKPAGNPQAEIEAQVCARQSDYCQENPVAPTRPMRAETPGNPKTSTQRILRWLASVLNLRRAGRAKKVSREEARRRAEICARCPRQQKLSSVCGACNATRKSAAAVLLGNDKRVNSELGGCRILHEDTSVSVHLVLEPVTNPELPENCWRR